MDKLIKLKEHEFVKILLADAQVISTGKDFKITDIELPNNTFLEWEFHIHGVGFYTMHLLHLCTELNSAIDFITNYNYKNTKSTAKRIEHLEYNLENFIIRLASMKDRTLQVFNAVFHIGMDEGDVSERTILNNLKVARTKLPLLISKLTKEIKKFSGERNTIVHRHTYLDKEIRKLHIFYSDFILGNSVENKFDRNTFKHFRTEMLKEFLQKKTVEMKEAIENLFSILHDIFNILSKEYLKVKKTLN